MSPEQVSLLCGLRIYLSLMAEETGSQRPRRAGTHMARDDFWAPITTHVRSYSLSTLFFLSYSLVKKKVSACLKEISASTKDAF